MNLAGCAEEIQHRIIHIFSRDEAGRRAVNGGNPKFNKDPYFRDYVHFFEVRLYIALNLANHSSSTETTDVVSAPAIRRAGLDSSPGLSTRPESSAVSRRPRRRRDLVSCPCFLTN